ncbi:hypothetical protein [Aeromicrobium duanguangcaii]|uniref:Fibronectin type-III domain-containing protein n=1 Tax=Aeromicrobium duanguangcaii TaxID=2968086 RepID=A0ABY5KGF0_9ACTN|nr:hypothetical protein [Aeromicrobium duanguangcaii]MCD9154012.1 hypothetical protein [Aeromicrobium duanguangcaii]MCL3837747.1 hypothetical protein [Aeromicrobium duanguangcaii]UUI68910.1 hypothetical protein NP095_02030 [Aeromicrobium duanguangcaii]
MNPIGTTSARALTLGTAGALVAGLIATTAAPANADNVDVPPTKTVSGELNGPIGMADDAAGNIYLASQNSNAVVVHRKNAQGASAPIRRIRGASTQLSLPQDVALDSNGFIYVANSGGAVLVFPPNANGNVAPTKVFGTGPGSALSLDIAGGEIYVRKPNGYNVYAPSATGSPATPERAVTGLAFSYPLAVHGSKVWVTSGTQLRAYSTSADGADTPIQVVANPGGVNTYGLDTDSAGRVYVPEFSGRLRVYAPNADGADGPLKVLGGPASGLQNVTGVETLSGGAVAIAGYTNNRYSVFSDLFRKPATKPGKVRALKVGGKATAKYRKISWKAPASNGGAKITSYRIVVRKGGKVLVQRTVGGSKRSIVVKRSQLRKGIDTVQIRAKNSKGHGPVAKRNFRVRK